MNVVPKTGGNTHARLGVLQRQRQEPAVRQLRQAPAWPRRRRSRKIYDLNGAVGGPIKKDALWYFVNARTQGSTRVNANQFFNLNAGDATKWLYAPDLEPARLLGPHVGEHQRPRHVAGDAAQQDRRLLGRAVGLPEVRGQHDRHHRLRRVVSPEAGGLGPTKPLRVPQVTWTSPVTNRLLLDAGFGGTYYGWGNFERDPNPTHDLIKVTEQCAAGCAANGNRPGIVYRSQDFGDNHTGSYSWKGNGRRTSPARTA